MTHTTYVVYIQDERGFWQISRLCNTVRVARNWAKWCARKWPVRITNQIGGMEVTQ